MRLRNSIYTLAIALACGSFMISGCTEEDTPTGGGGNTIQKIVTNPLETNHQITGLSKGQRYVIAVGGASGTLIKGLSSSDEGSINVTWTRAAGDVGVDSIFYQTVDATVTTPPTTLTVNGVVYQAQTWATATKYGPFKLYESRLDSTALVPQMSGLVITSSGATQVKKDDPLQANNVDFFLLTDNTLPSLPYLYLAAGSVNVTSGQKTTFGDVYSVVGGASQDWFPSGVASLIHPTDGVIIEPQALVAGETAIAPFKTEDGYYGRVEIQSFLNPALPGPNNYILWQDEVVGGKSWRTITVNVYYQTVQGWDYVSNHQTGNGPQ